MKLRIDTPRITFEQIDDETIVIDFDSGAYFSAGPIGSSIIRQISLGASLERIVADAKVRYSGDPEDIERGVRAFVDSLRCESILVETTDAASPEAPPPPPITAKTAYQAPVLNKYTDMKDLLLLDPIHEVDAEGWPVRKPDA